MVRKQRAELARIEHQLELAKNHYKKQPRANLHVKEKHKQINQKSKKQSRKSGQNVIKSLKFIPLPVI